MMWFSNHRITPLLLLLYPFFTKGALESTPGQLHANTDSSVVTPFVPHSSQLGEASYVPVTFPLTDSSSLHHGRGLVTGVPKVYLILVGGWTAAEISQLDLFMVGFSKSDWLRHLNWASGMAQSFAYQGYWLSHATIESSNGNPVLNPIMQVYAPTDPTAIYVILTNSDVGLDGCGFHSGTKLNDGSTPNLIWGNRNAGCNDGHVSLPSGDKTFDSMGSIVAHEMAELFTDPFPNVGQGVAICQSGCSEVADICSSLPLNTQIDTATGARYNVDYGVGGKWQLQDVLGIVGYGPNNNAVVGCQAAATTMATLLQRQYLTEQDTLTSYSKVYKLQTINGKFGVWNQNTGTQAVTIATLASTQYWLALDPTGCLILYGEIFPSTRTIVWRSNDPPGAASGPYWATLTNDGQINLMNSYSIIWKSTNLPASPTTQPPPSPTAPQAGTCGGGNVGNALCPDSSLCCSKYGWCGTGSAYCGSSPAPPVSAPVPVPAGTCGNGNIGNGLCPDGTMCCSKYGYCGTSSAYCGSSPVSSPVASPTLGTCGNGNIGNGRCSDGTMCCSKYGYCGTGSAYCGSNPVSSPVASPTPGTCGNGNIGNGLCLDGTLCCSKYGYCGSGSAYCGSNPVSSPVASPTPGTCGNGNIGNGLCPDGTLCCSKYGYCGTGSAYCGR